MCINGILDGLGTNCLRVAMPAVLRLRRDQFKGYDSPIIHGGCNRNRLFIGIKDIAAH